MSKTHEPTRWPVRPTLGVIALIAVALRVMNWTRIFSGGEVYFVGSGTYYHFRRMLLAQQSFPRFPPRWDAYLGFPEGFNCFWSPPYDWLMGGVARLLNLAPHEFKTLLAFLPVACGLVTVWLAFRVGRRLFGEQTGLATAFLTAGGPTLLSFTMLGRPSHHCLEAMGALLFVEGLLAAPPEAGATGALLAGVLIALNQAFWEGGAFLCLLLLMVHAAARLVARAASPVGKGDYSLIVFTAAAAAAGLTLSYPWIGLGTQETLSWLWHTPEPFASTSAFMSPLVFQGHASLNTALAYFSPLLLVLPLALAWVLLAQPRDWRSWFLLFWCLAMAPFGLGKVRFVHFLCVPLFLVCGRVVAGLFESARSGPATARRLHVAAACLMLATPLVSARRYLNPPDVVFEPALFSSLRWLEAHSPDPRTAEGTLSYGVFSDQDIGPLITVEAHRPAVVANMHTLGTVIQDGCFFFLTPDEGKAREILRRRKARYVVVRELLGTGTFGACARALKLPLEDFIAARNGRIEPLVPFTDSMYARLYYGPSQKSFGAPPTFLKLVHDSEESSPGPTADNPRVRIYEVRPL